MRLVLLAALVLMSFPLVIADQFYDVNPHSITTGNNDQVCFGMRIKINSSGVDMNLTGAIQADAARADTAYFYNDSRPSWTVQNSCPGDFDASVSFSDRVASVDGGLVVHDGEVWVVAFDNTSAAPNWNSAYSGAVTGNETGNSSLIIYDCSLYTLCQTSNWFVGQGVTIEDLASATEPSPDITRIDAWDNLLLNNVTINPASYTDVLLQTATLPTDTSGTIGATVNVYSGQSSTALCRVTVNDTDYDSEVTRTNAAGAFGSMYVQTSNVTLSAGDYEVALECRRSGSGSYTITEALVAGLLTNITTSGHTYAGLSLEADYTVLQNTNRTTSNTTNNATNPLYLVADYSAQYDYANENGVIETVFELGGQNCTSVPRYGNDGDSGSVGGSCRFLVTNETDYTVRVYGRGNGTVDYDFTLKEMVIDVTEQNQSTLNGESFSSSTLSYLTHVNLSLTDNVKAVYAKAGIPTNGSGLVTYQLRLNVAAGQNGEEIKRNVSGQTGVSIMQEYFNNLNIGDYSVELWAACSSGTCDIQGGDLVAYAVDQLSTQVQGFTVTANDLYDDTAINEYIVEFKNINFTTTNGSLIVPTNDALANFSIHKEDYLSSTVQDWDTGNFHVGNISQGWMENETLSTIFGTTVSWTTANFTLGTKTYTDASNTTPVYLTAGNNTITINVSGWYSNTVTHAHTATEVDAPNLTGFYDNLYTIGAEFDGSGLSNFTINATNTTFSYDDQVTTANGSIIYPLVQSYFYDFTFTSDDYAKQTQTLEANASAQTYNFSVLLTNTFNLHFIDEITEAFVNESVTVELISESFAANYTIPNNETDGYNISLLVPEYYTIRYRSDNYTERDYIIRLNNGSFENLTLYMITLAESSDVVVTVEDTGAERVENATVSLLRYFVSCNCYNIVEMGSTSPAGESVFWVQAIEGHYKWSVDYLENNEFLSTSPENIVTDTRVFTINLGDDFYESFEALTGLGKTLTYTQHNGALTFTWSDPALITSQGCLEADYVNGSRWDKLGPSCVAGTSGSVILTLDNTTNYKYHAYIDTTTTYSDHTIFSGFIDNALSDYDYGQVGAFLSGGVIVGLSMIFSFSAVAILVINALGVLIVSWLGFMPFQQVFIVSFAAMTIGMGIFVLRK